MNLVVGATGHTGIEICRLLVEQGHEVRGLVRATADPARVARLREIGVGIVEGDLHAPESLARACDGVAAVISTATATGAAQPGDTVVNVDGEGQLALVDAAAAAGVGQFVFISFSGNLVADTPLSRSKRAVEARLRESDMTWTILRPGAFQEIWLSPLVGFNVPEGNLVIYGTGGAPISYISFADVARFAAGSLREEWAWNRTIELGGPDAVTPLQAVRMAEEVTGREMSVQHVPVEALRAQYEGATDPLQKSFAGLMLSMADGDAIDMAEPLRHFPLQLRTVRDHLEAAYGIAPDIGGSGGAD
ncbi:MAG TPA: SDR family oxidoreductase [Longimicrobiales bacterium]|nr:SDR family oxidoreductase [Longimicrobiales bacterium]